MNDKLIVCLRENPKNPRQSSKMLVEREHVGTSEDSYAALFDSFVKEAAKVARAANLDVYVGYWTEDGQGTLRFPPSFCALLGDRRWALTVDLND